MVRLTRSGALWVSAGRPRFGNTLREATIATVRAGAVVRPSAIAAYFFFQKPEAHSQALSAAPLAPSQAPLAVS